MKYRQKSVYVILALFIFSFIVTLGGFAERLTKLVKGIRAAMKKESG